MALNFYCGSPGAGKSYHVVKEVVIQALLNGKNIITNLPLKMGEIYKAFPQLVEQNNYVQVIAGERIKEIHKIVDAQKYAGWVIIIDEAHDYWPSNEAMKDEGFKTWLSQHRHKFQNIVMITQDFTNINKFVRSMVQERYEFEKNESRGSEKSYMQDFFLKQSKKRVDRKICKYEPEYFKFYRSHDVGLADAGFKEVRVGKKMNLLRKPMLIIVFSLIGCVVAFFSFFNKLSSSRDAAIEAEQEQVSAKNGSIGRGLTLSTNRPVGPLQPNKPLLQNLVGGSGGNGFDWCRGISFAGVGVSDGFTVKREIKGFSMAGGHANLNGAYIVTGAMIMPGKAVYFVKDSKRTVFKVEFESKRYSVGQEICL